MAFGGCRASGNKAASDAVGKLRIVDATGALSNAGQLQVQTSNGEFGSVCGMSLEAADVVCRQIGYDFGSVSSSPCGSYGGSQLCGATGMPVAMQDLRCEGGELNIQDCSWDSPGAGCADHTLDSVVFCGIEDVAGKTKEGALRLLSFDGSPSIDGEGRLEMFKDGSWAPVCSNGFTAGSETVACKSMGFRGAQAATVLGIDGCGLSPESGQRTQQNRDND